MYLKTESATYYNTPKLLQSKNLSLFISKEFILKEKGRQEMTTFFEYSACLKLILALQ